MTISLIEHTENTMTLQQLLRDYQNSVNKFNDVLEKGDGALSMYDIMMGYDAEFYLSGNCPLLVNHVLFSKQKLLEFYENCGFAYTEEINLLKAVKEIPDNLSIPEFNYSTLFNKNLGVHIPKLVNVGDIIICSYSRHSIYTVKKITGSYNYYGNNEKIVTPDHYSLICTQKDSNQTAYLNNLVSANDKIIPLLKSDDSQYFHIKYQDRLNNPDIINQYYVPWNVDNTTVEIPIHKPEELAQEQLSFF